MTRPSGLILDFGGVLTSDLWRSVRSCARREGLPEDALLDLLHHDAEVHRSFVALERGEIAQADFERQLGRAAGIAGAGLLARMCADLVPQQAMLSAMAVLRNAGIRLAVLSNSWGSGYFSPYDGYDLADRVDVVVLSDRVRLRKPEPSINRTTVELLGAPASRCVFVDDVAANLAPAEAMGMRVVHHTSVAETLERLGELFHEELTPTA